MTVEEIKAEYARMRAGWLRLRAELEAEAPARRAQWLAEHPTTQDEPDCPDTENLEAAIRRWQRM
jgi:hypothetical protein